MKTTSLLIAIAATAWTPFALADDPDYVTLGAAYVVSDSAREVGPGLGASVGYGHPFSATWALEGRGFANLLRPDNKDLSYLGTVGVGADLLFSPWGRTGFYGLAGGGILRTGPDADAGSGPFGNVAIGWRSRFSETPYRLELRLVADQSGDGYLDALLGVVIELPTSCPACTAAAAPATPAVTALSATADADADGVADAVDQCPSPQRNPEVGADGCAWQEQVLTVTFASTSSTLTAETRARLDEVAGAYAARPDLKIDIQGHSDGTHSEAFNLKLSKARATAVRDYLVQKGIAAERLTAEGFGEMRPAGSNENERGKAANRRVELHIRTHQPG